MNAQNLKTKSGIKIYKRASPLQELRLKLTKKKALNFFEHRVNLYISAF